MVLLYHIAYQNASRSIATILYIDDLDNVFIEWVSNGRLTSFSKKNFKSLFEMAS